MATAASTIRISGLSRRLINDGYVSEQDAANAQKEAHDNGIALTTYLVKNELIDASDLAHSASNEFGIPLLNINSVDLESLPSNIVPEKLIRQHHALPVQKRGNRLFVAISDPMNLAALDEFKFNTGITTEAVLVEEDKLEAIIDKALELGDKSLDMDGLLDDDLDNLDVTSGDDDLDESGDSDVDDTPIVRFVNKCLLDAINKKASDIHFEPYEKVYRVRFRIDGVLEEIANPPTEFSP